MKRVATARAGLAAALGAAALFGAVNAVGRDAVDDIHPVALVAVAYALAGTALLPFLRGARFTRRELAGVATVAVVGGAGGPVLFFLGLSRTTAVNASLLLMTEIVFTTLLAVIFLRERLHAREWVGAALLVAGAALVALGGRPAGSGLLLGDALVIAAALCWSVDNAISAKLAARQPAVRLVAMKGLLGALVVGSVALAWGLPLDVPRATWPHLAFIGLLGIGASTVLFYVALGAIGAARTTLIFATSGFFGVAAGVLALREPFGWTHAGAAALLAAGVLTLFAFRPAPRVVADKPA